VFPSEPPGFSHGVVQKENVTKGDGRGLHQGVNLVQVFRANQIVVKQGPWNG